MTFQLSLSFFPQGDPSLPVPPPADRAERVRPGLHRVLRPRPCHPRSQPGLAQLALGDQGLREALPVRAVPADHGGLLRRRVHDGGHHPRKVGRGTTYKMLFDKLIWQDDGLLFLYSKQCRRYFHSHHLMSCIVALLSLLCCVGKE